MELNPQRRAQRTRRRFLGSFGLATVGLVVAAQPGAATHTATDSAGEFVLEQGGQCVPVVPLSSDVPVEERYGWGRKDADYSATGLVDLQRPDTSIVFLYDGPNGLSLVIVHDKYGDGTDGGSATFEFAGLPLDGEWVVQDDFYDEDSNYDRWARDGDQATVDWTWTDGRTDGAAFRGLGADPELELRIDPAFNAAAALHTEYYDGEITDWELLSESADGLTRTALALEDPIVLRRGTCSSDETGDDDEADDHAGDGDDGDDEREEEEDTDSDVDDDDEEADENEDEDDDHPGHGKGHEKKNGKGHQHGTGNGHERHGDDEGDEHPGKGKGKSKAKGKGKKKGKSKGKGKR